MLSKTLSTSAKVARLHKACPKLAEFCRLLFPLLIAHADDWGRLPGDEETVKLMVDPISPRRLSDFVAALHLLHEVNLITWYQVGERKVIEIVDFANHQDLKGHPAKRDPKLPACPGPEALIGRSRRHPARDVETSINMGMGEKSPQIPPITEPNRTEIEPKGTEPNRRESLALARRDEQELAFQQFRDAYPAHRRVGGKEGRRAFDSALKGRDLSLHLSVMLAALEQHTRSEQWQNPKFIPLMTTWLNQERWDTVLEPATHETSEQTRMLVKATKGFLES